MLYFSVDGHDESIVVQSKDSDMKSDTFKGSVESAYGEKLAKAVDFSGTFEAFENYEELTKANEIPSNDEILQFVNAKRKNNARQKAMTDALEAAGISKPDPNDPKVVVARMLRDIEKLDMPEDQKKMLAEVLKAKQTA
jgi:hypothetical protein